MSARIYISRDSGALCVGAEGVVTAFRKAFEKRGLKAEILRTGSRGMYWLEPLVEVTGLEGRIGYGPVGTSDVDGLIDAIPTDAVYVTIDKDAFSPTEAATNWDQGEMPLDHVLAVVEQLARSKRLVGADVCGDYSPPIFATLPRKTWSG